MFCLPDYTLKTSVLVSMFFAGALGGVMHCSGMCGGFGLSFASQRYAKIPTSQFTELRRFFASALLPYHAGRILTYTALGFASAYVSSLISSYEFFAIFRAVILGFAILMFIASAFSLSGFLGGVKNSSFSKIVEKYSSSFFRKPDSLNLFFAGVVLGFLPCTMVYSALLSSAASANPIAGAAIVASFGLGTVLPLILTTYGFGYFIKKFRNEFRKVTSVLMTINSLILIIIIFRSF